MRIVVDECVRRRWIPFLAESGYVVDEWMALAGRQGAPDHELFEWARAADAVILTADGDLGQLVWAQGADRPTVVQLDNPTWRPEEHGVTVLDALAECEARVPDHFFILVRADRRYRIRRLPST